MEAPAAVTWMLPLYVPAVRPPMFTAAVIVPLLAPEVVPLKLRNAPLVTKADQFSAPPPALLIPTVWLAGLLPPCTAVKDSEAGFNPMAGGAGVTWKLWLTEGAAA